jgi:hypothetical protein
MANRGRYIIRLQPENYGWPINLCFNTRYKEVTVLAGCRDLDLVMAKQHWTAVRHHKNESVFNWVTPERRQRAANMLALLPKLRRRAIRYGWIKPKKETTVKRKKKRSTFKRLKSQPTWKRRRKSVGRK